MAKRAKKAATPPVKITSFKEMTEAFINTVGQIVLTLKVRAGGAATYGADGLFVAAVELLHTARQNKSLEDYLKAAAYSVGAALKSCGAWEYPLTLEEKEGPKKAAKKNKKEKEA
ncbi:hypothetical protein LCGC14_2702710 [marine sediment metagenome]|uniref:Uncharacterized protein n=1 Tax=marine sediment metagenome TaxID=412755 RepID=A0A0F9C780_9ZZZZ